MQPLPPSLLRRLRHWLPVLCAWLAVFIPLLLFLPTRHHAFIALDDASYVLHNPVVTAGLSWENVRRAFIYPGPAPMWLPVLWLSYMADVTLFGAGPLNAVPFHVVNAILHALGTGLLFILFLRLSRRPGPSLLLALLWAIHPLRVESVAWVSERKDVLSLVFLLGSLHAWLSFLRAGRPGLRAGAWTVSLMLFALGLLVKPSIVPLPVLFGVLALPPCITLILGLPPAVSSNRPFRDAVLRLLKILWPFLLLALAAARLSVATHDAYNDLLPVPLATRLLTIPSVAFFYLSKTFFPVRLSLIYPSWTSALLPGLLGFAILLVAAVAVFRSRNRLPFLWLGTVFAALFFAPISGIVQVPFNLVADRFSYLPAMGLSIALLGCRPTRPARRTALVFLLLLAVAAEAVLSARHLPCWTNTRSIYGTVRTLQPDHVSVRLYDAQEAFRRGNFDDARRALHRAADAAGGPDVTMVVALAPVVCAQSGISAFLDFLHTWPVPSTDPMYPTWCFDLALAHLGLGDCREALSVVSTKLPAIPPHNPNREPIIQLGMVAAHSLGLESQALDYAGRLGVLVPGQTSLSLPDFSPFYLHLWHEGFRDIALGYYRDVLRAYPIPDTYNNVAWLSASAFWGPATPEETLSWAQRALDLEPPSSPRRPGILDTLAAALANAGRFDDAVATLSEALEAVPDGHSSRPAMLRRLDLFRQRIPYREIKEVPVPTSEYEYIVAFPPSPTKESAP